MDNQTQNQTNNVDTTTQPQENTKFCKHCGGKIAEKAVICPLCGCQVEEINNQNNQQPIVINNTNNNSSVANATAVAGGYGGRMKNKWVALVLCFFLGVVGGHKFYEGKTGMGILYIFTGGLFFIGVLIDFIVLLTKPNPYYV